MPKGLKGFQKENKLGEKNIIFLKNWIKKNGAWNKGKKGQKYPNRKSPPPFSNKHKRKIGEKSKGRILSKKTRKKISEAQKGEKSYLWKGGITPENKRIRKSIEFRLWRESVFARDNWTCQKCKIRGGKLHPHHIQNFAQITGLRFEIDNGITLCRECHREFHKKYGRKNNTMEQLREFLS